MANGVLNIMDSYNTELALRCLIVNSNLHTVDKPKTRIQPSVFCSSLIVVMNFVVDAVI